MRGKRASTVRGGADGKGQLLYLAGGLLHSEGGRRKRGRNSHLAGGLPDESYTKILDGLLTPRNGPCCEIDCTTVRLVVEEK